MTSAKLLFTKTTDQKIHFISRILVIIISFFLEFNNLNSSVSIVEHRVLGTQSLRLIFEYSNFRVFESSNRAYFFTLILSRQNKI
jgi:hypothetical protein